MSCWEIEADWNILVFDIFEDDLLGGLSKWYCIVVHLCQTADDKSFDVIQFACAFLGCHHPVDMIEIFVEVFKEQYFSICIWK